MTLTHTTKSQPKPFAQSSLWLGLVVLTALIGIGIASRFLLADIPNFKPIGAIALFAAFYFQRFWVSGLAVLMVVLASNLGLANCPWQVTLGVVGGLLVASALGRRLQRIETSASSINKVSNLLGSSLLMSVAFFVVSNASVWMMGQWYPLTANGLVQCFASAVPFFRFTLASDLLFTTGLFGGYFAVMQLTATDFKTWSIRKSASAL